jgi:mono/diheme cytochrome c family protein
MPMKSATTRIVPIALLTFAVWTASTLVASAQDAKKGEQVYAAQKCMTCHAISGKGNKNNPLDGIGAKLSADEIRHWIVDPVDAAAKAKSTKKPPMPNRYSKLPADDISNMVAYIQSLK